MALNRDDWMNCFLRYPSALRMRARIAFLRLIGVRIRGRCWIQRVEIPRNPWDIVIERAALDDFVVLLTTGARQAQPRIVIRPGVYINRFTMLDASEHIEIGESCMIGPHCYITDHDHGHQRGTNVAVQPLQGCAVRVGKDAWIGAGAIILKGVEVGEGAIVGAGSVVTRSIPPFAKVAGIPARPIGVRS